MKNHQPAIDGFSFCRLDVCRKTWCKTDSLMELDVVKGTPAKFNMEPENQPLEKEIPIGNHHFQVPC